MFKKDKGIRVAYDIDFLGLGYTHPKDRAGVYRVVEHIAEGLVASGCNINFVADQYFNAAVAYLESNPRLAHLTLRAEKVTPYEVALRRSHAYLRQVEQAALKRHYERRETFPAIEKAYRKALFSMHALLPPYHGRLTKADHRVYEQAQVYHSPFSRIADPIRQFEHLKCFLTVYDLIPILFPQYVNFATSSWTHMAIDSLKPQDWVFAISQATKDDLCNYRKDIRPEQVIVTHLAAAREKFYPCLDPARQLGVREKFGIPKQAKYLLGLSTLAPHKNFVKLIRCFKRVLEQERLQDLYLVLVGIHGLETDKILEESRSAPWLSERIIFTGRVEEAELAPLYSGATAFAYLSNYEGFGLPPLEAMQCGIPVITSNTSSLPEVVGDAGIMVNPDDEDAISQALLRIYRDPVLHTQLSKGSLSRAATFSWEKCVQQTVEGYQQAVYG